MSWGQLHLHTLASDGDINFDAVLKAGLSFVAATDHDTLTGVDYLAGLAQKNILLIPGIELTIRFQGRRFHLLILEPSPAPGFQQILTQLGQQRRQRLQRVRERLTNAGLRLGTPQTARLLPTRREVTDAVWNHPANQDKLARFGFPDVRAMVRHFLPKEDAALTIHGVAAEEALPLIGGIHILAHPGKSLDLKQEAAILEAFVRRFPLSGLEAVTRKHQPHERTFCTNFAESHGLVAVTTNDAHDPEASNLRRTTPDKIV